MGYPLKQSQTAQNLVFLLVSSTDHITGVTGATPTVTLSKNGGAFAAPAGAVTEIGDGWYKVAGNATDAETLGPLLLHATATGADPVDEEFYVVAFDPQSATNLGLSALPTASPNANGGLPVLSSSGTTLAYTISTLTTYTGNTPQTGDAYAVATNATYGNSALHTAIAAIPTNPLTTLGTNAPVGWINAAAIASAALDGKGDWLASGSYPANFGTLSVDASGRVLLQPTQTGVTIPTVTSVTSTVNAALTSAGLDNVIVEAAAGGQSALNARQALALIMDAAPAGILTGAGTTTVTVKNPGGTVNRIVATVDSSGNRSAVTITPPA